MIIHKRQTIFEGLSCSHAPPFQPSHFSQVASGSGI